MGVWITFPFVQAVLDFRAFGFYAPLTFVHYKFSPLIRLSYAKFGLCTADKHFKLSRSGAPKLSPEMYFVSTKCQKGWSQWPHCLMCGSAAVCLLVLWVRIPPGSCMSFVWVLCLVRLRSLRWAGHLSIGLLPSVVCLRQRLHETTWHAACWLVYGFSCQWVSKCLWIC